MAAIGQSDRLSLFHRSITHATNAYRSSAQAPSAPAGPPSFSRAATTLRPRPLAARARPSPAASSTMPGRRWRRCGPVVPGAEPRALFVLHATPAKACQGRGLRAGKRPGARGHQDRAVRRTRRGAPPKDVVIASSSSGLLITPRHRRNASIRNAASSAIRSIRRISFRWSKWWAAPKTSAEAIVKAMEFYLTRRQASDPHQEGSGGPCRQPAAGGAVARGDSPRRRRRGVGCRCGCRDCLWPRPALGADGAVIDVSSGRRRRRHAAFHVASRPGGAELDGRSRRHAADADRFSR